MNASERIEAILKTYNISAKTLSERAGMDRPQAIYDILSGKTKSITEKMAGKIISVFPDISLSWFMSGVGEMQANKTIAMSEKDSSPEQKIPLFDIAAAAGFATLYQDHPQIAESYLSIPNLPPVDGAIYARGDSMTPLISSGDIVIFKKVDLSPNNILWGHIYIISYEIEGDDYTVLKYIRRSPKAGYIRLESYNNRYNALDIPAASITALALVKASISFHTIG